jgi:hypothetical protein
MNRENSNKRKMLSKIQPLAVSVLWCLGVYLILAISPPTWAVSTFGDKGPLVLAIASATAVFLLLFIRRLQDRGH